VLHGSRSSSRPCSRRSELQVMKLTLHVWRRRAPQPRRFVRYDMTDVSRICRSSRCSTVLTSSSSRGGKSPSLSTRLSGRDLRRVRHVINGRPHGPQRATTACQLHMRTFPDGAALWIEPWRAKAFPSSRTWWSTARHSIASSKQADSSPRARAAPRGQLDARAQGDADSRWTPRHASDAVLRAGLPKRLGDVVRGGQGVASRAAAQGQPERSAAW